MRGEGVEDVQGFHRFWDVFLIILIKNSFNYVRTTVCNALDFGFWTPILLQCFTWAMLFLLAQNYPQIVGTYHGQLISKL